MHFFMNLLFVLTAAFWGRRLCVYTEGREKVNEKKWFFREKSQLSFWGDGMAGVSVRKWANYEGDEGRRRCTS